MRHLFWIGVGVAGAVMATRWVRKQRERYGPANVADRLAQATLDLGRLVVVSVQEGRRAMAAKEAEIRTALDEGRPVPTEDTPGS